MTDKTFETALKRYDEACDAWREQRERMLEELRFSNPADPQQWDQKAKQIRESGPAGARPCLTLDHTNQYIAQVVNDARQNSPAIHFLPATSGAREEVAKALEGIARHIEYRSRAQIAYDTALEHAARCSVGWFRIVPEVVDEELNYQEIRIQRIHDPLSVTPAPDWTEPDGSDMPYCFIETTMTKEAFKAQYPKADPKTFKSRNQNETWFGAETIKVCEYLERVKVDTQMVVVVENGVKRSMTADEYQQAVESGQMLEVANTYASRKWSVMWRKMSGVEFLEETEFPSCYMPIFPVIGNEVWVEGKRYLAGMTRKMMDAQRAYNYERSAWVEAVALQPKAPFVGPAEAIAGHEQQWATANSTNHSYLPVNVFDEEGRPLPPPQRQGPPPLPAAFAQGAQFAEADLQASVGMYKASLGAPTQEHSGRAILAKQREGDTANFHFQDNQSRSIEQAGRVMLDMIVRLYDEPREARILGTDGSTKPVLINAKGDPYALDGDMTSINPSTGTYDVRVQTGPAYSTLRQEAAEGLTQMMQGNPGVAAIVAPIWARMQDWPEADKLSKALMAMAPPPVRQAMKDEQGGASVDVLKQKLQAQQQQMEQMNQMMMQAAQHITELQAESQQAKLELLAKLADTQIKEYDAETKRIQVLGTTLTPEAVAAIAQQTVQQALMREPLGDAEQLEHVIQGQMGMPDDDPYGTGMEAPEAATATEPAEAAEPMEPSEPQEPKEPAEMSDEELMGELQ